MPIARIAPSVKAKQLLTLKDQPKLEGTSTTYGQNITIAPSFKTAQAFSTKQSREGNNVIDSLERPPSMVSRTATQPSVTAGTKIVPQDTTVRIVQRTEQVTSNNLGVVSMFSSTAKSNIALAAVSANTNTSIALSGQPLISQTHKESKLSLSTLTSLSKVIPNVEDNVVVKGSLYKNKEEQKRALIESQKVDMLIAMKSKESESIDLNTLKVPELSVNFRYNFFEETEEDIDLQEDQAQDPLINRKPIDTPRFAELSWNAVEVTEPLTGAEKEFQKNKELRKNTFSTKKGVISYNSSNFRDSVDKGKKLTDTTSREGVDVKLVDIHMSEVAFDSIANQKSFPNTMAATINSQDQQNTIPSIPVSTQPAAANPSKTASSKPISGAKPLGSATPLGSLAK